MKVLLELDGSDTRKGAIRNALDLAQLAPEFGFTCLLCGCLDSDFKVMAARLGLATTRGRSRMYSRRGLPIYAAHVAWWIVRLMRLRPDIVHLNYTGWGPSLGCAAYLSGIPVVSRAGGDYDARNLAAKWVRAYVANSTEHGRTLLHSPLAERVVVTGPLVLLAPAVADQGGPLPPRRASGCRLLFLGQVVERKGIAVLVDALPFLSPDVDLLVVGGSWNTEAYASAIRERLRQSGLADRMHLMDHRSDVQDMLRSVDFLVVPSLQDTLPRVIIEAMFSGVPVVATRVGAVPTVVKHGVTGFLVRPGDATGLADAINRLAASRDLRERLGQAARAFAEAHLRPTVTMTRYAELYKRLQSAR